MISFFAAIYLLLALSLFIYSYGFVDFNLTLSSNPIVLRFITFAQSIVMFDRPLSANIYVTIFSLFFVIYLCVLYKVKKSYAQTFPYKLFFTLVFILTLCYPIFSYDLFNYMFHAKILWLYHQNPLTHAPLEYQADLWLRFMRWVHTPSAYGPLFTVIESPAYLLGLGKFVPVLILMKITISSFFVWSIYLIKYLGLKYKFSKTHITFAQYLIAFNPFLLLELVINGHNDAVMIALFLFSLTVINSKKILGIISLIASVSVKYITAITLPAYFVKKPKQKIALISILLLLPVLFSPGRFQPWYLVWAMIPSAMIMSLSSQTWIILTSLSALIYYYPFVATGFWNNSSTFVYPLLYLPTIISLIIFYTKKISTSL